MSAWTSAIISALDQLKQWQTLIGATLGFGGLMTAAMWNAHLNRKRDTLLRYEEANSVAAALYGEILLLRREISEVAKVVSAMELKGYVVTQHFLDSHKSTAPHIFQALSAKLGLLPADTLLGIIGFHQDLQEAWRLLPLLVSDPKRAFDYTITTFLKPASDAVRNVCPTLRQIETRLQIATYNEDCDLGHVDDVIEREASVILDSLKSQSLVSTPPTAAAHTAGFRRC